MTQVTPPGWYPDPGQTHDGPPTERWWDGKAWTDQTRPAGTAATWGPPAGPPAPAGPVPPAAPGYGAYPGFPGYPSYPAYPASPTAASRRGLRTGIAAAVAAAVLASIGVGVFALAEGDGGSDRAAQQRPGNGQDGGRSGGPGGSDGASPSPNRSGAPRIKGGGTVPDPVNGISLPVPKGWTGQPIGVGAQVTSDHSYTCPGNSSQTCTAGGAYTAPAQALGIDATTAEEAAKADIPANAKESYGGDTYGGITSHQVLASQTVTVAGQKGYLVRWKAVTSKGADGLVESVAFPSPNDAKQLVVVRFGIDAGQSTSVIDEILKGIKGWSGGGRNV